MIIRLTAWLFVSAFALSAVPPPAKPLWSLQPFAVKSLPVVKNTAWPHSRVDHFILARLEGSGLAPGPDAAPLTLLRRVYFDIIGLPPSLEEIEAFEESWRDDPAAGIRHVIDRLLASPEFGARWGRHWLDVARYAETSGNTRNMAYVLAWRYRNYVVRAFNRDTPFDEFIREQIAGDLLQPAADPARHDDQLLATGFLNVGVKSLGEQDAMLYDMNVADDQIDATCHAFLALSVNCARCHDHKFDPISTADYHALAGIFRSTRNLSGVETNNVTKEAEAMPLGTDGPRQFAAVKQHEKDLADMTKGYVAVAKKRSTMRDEIAKMSKDAAVRAMPTLSALDKEFEQWRAKLSEKQKNAPSSPPLGMTVRDAETPIDCPIFDKGEIKKPLTPVKRGVLSAIPVRLAPIGLKESGRKQLADWIASAQNPLTARVIVNRVWQHLFGRGLVESADDFGNMGRKPSHPELLDDLAAHFVRDGWSVKSLIRELMLSRAYQLSSNTEFSGSGVASARRSASSDPHLIDSANVLLWRANKKRLEAEPLRDAILYLGGTLDLAPLEGSPIADKARAITPQGREVGRKHFLADLEDNTTHRSIYLPIVRGAQMPMMQCFNAADPGQIIGERSRSITPVQSLLLMNSGLVVQQAENFARRLTGANDDEKLKQAWKTVFCRVPTAAELGVLRSFLAAGGSWAELCHALLQSGEFQTLD